MEKISVSVIIPVYNVEKYLSRCLESLVNQTLKNIEFICINNGSSDNSLEILKKYAANDKRVKIITQINKGVSAARNEGLKTAKGEYIGFCDPDDWVELTYFEKLYNSAIKNNADIAVGNIIRKKKKKSEEFYITNDTYITDDYLKKLKICNVPNFNYIWNKIYKTSSFKKANLSFVEGRCYEDIIFTPQVLYSLKKLITVDAFYFYFYRTNSIVNTKSNKPDYKKACEYALNFIKNKGIDINELIYKTKRYKLFGFTILRKTTRTKSPYFKIRYD